MARDYKDAKAVIKIQTCWRRVMAKKRVVSKRQLDQNALEAMEAVNPQNLLELDVKELGGWIQLALNEPHEYSFPPDEVLTLLKMSSMLLLAGEGYAGITTYDHIGARFHVETNGFDLNWESAMKLINRSDKYLRRVRGLAYAPVSKPPRLITLPSEVVSLYKLESQNKKFCLETFENLLYGSKFCVKLYKWLDCMVQVAIVQGKFFDFIGEKFPEWLPKLFDIQKKIRKCDFEILLNERCLLELDDVILNHKQSHGENEDGVDHYLSTLEKEREKVENDKSAAQQRLQNFQRKERDYGQEQNAIEIMTMKSFQEKLIKKEDEIKDAVTKYMQLNQLAEDGEVDVEEKLNKSLETITQLTIELKELKIQFGLLKLQIDNNAQKRNNKKKFTPDIVYKIYQAGEAKAKYILLVVDKAVLLLDNNIRSEDGLHLHPEVEQEYMVLQSKDKVLKLRYRTLLKGADDDVEEFHSTIISEMKQQELDEKNDTARFIPTDEELHIERLEDDSEAKLERFAKLLYVSRKILDEVPKRKHPLIVAFTCDVPYNIKRTLISKIHDSVPNFFEEIPPNRNMGIDIVELQKRMQHNQSVIVTVDHGLTQITRSNFIKNYNMVWNSLSHEPITVFIQGDELNQRTPIHDPRYGVYHHDIEHMRDYDIKYALENISYITKRFLQPHIKKKMSSMYSSISYPSFAYVIVLEALYIVQSKNNEYNIPDRNITKVSYNRSKILLMDSYILYQRLMSLKRGQSDYYLCQIIQYYLKHQHWPKQPHKERKEDELLHLLASFVEEWVKREILTYQRGGMPTQGDLKLHIQNCLSVITITDSFQPMSSSISSLNFLEDNILTVKKSGWMTPLTYLYKAIFHELRVYHTVKKIDVESNDLYQINVYRNSEMIYFDAYNPKSSQCYHTAISINDVPSLLVPSVLAMKDGKLVLCPSDKQINPPASSTELYLRLVNLLQVRRLIKLKDSKKELICKRRNIFIKRYSTKICGHNVMLNCYESGMSELYFEGYLPEYSATLLFHLNDVNRLKMLANCDQLLEYHMLDSTNSLDILPYVVDRLRIYPNKSMKLCQEKNYLGEIVSAQANPLKRTSLHQGYRLALSARSGAGKYLIRTTISFLGVPHVMTLKSSSINQTLIIVIYEPITQRQQELRINAFVRKVILRNASDNYKLWLDTLIRKLKLNYQHKRELILDMVIYRKMHMLSQSTRERLIFTVSVVNEVSIQVTLFNPITCDSYECELKKDAILDLLLYPSSELLNSFEKATNIDVLEFIKQRRDYYQTYEATKVSVLMTHSLREISFSEIPFEEILCYTPCLQHLTKQLSILLQKDESANSYCCLCSTKLDFRKPVIEVAVEEKQEDVMSLVSRALSRASSSRPSTAQGRPHSTQSQIMQESEKENFEERSGFDVSFRYKKRLKQRSHSGGSVEEVISRRRQAPIVFVEQHLDELARSKTEAANNKILSDGAAAVALAKALSASCNGVTLLKEDRSVHGSADCSERFNEDDSTIHSEDKEAAKEFDPLTINSPRIQSEAEKFNDDQSISGKSEKESENSAGLIDAVPVVDDQILNLERYASLQTIDDIISELEAKERSRWVERLNPGTMQREHFERKLQEESERDLQKTMASDEPFQREIVIRKEMFVFDKKLRVNYREGLSRWGATAQVSIYESTCWDGAEGVGRKLRFVVHDTKTNLDFEGTIRGTSHLRQVLGKHGVDLIPTEKTTEMILFLCRHRLEVVRNTTTPTGEPVTAPDAPIYRIEFMIPEILENSKSESLSEAEKKKKSAEDEQVAQSKYEYLIHLLIRASSCKRSKDSPNFSSCERFASAISCISASYDWISR